MMKRLLAIVLAGALVAPQICLASVSAVGHNGAGQAPAKFPEKLPLPPIPYLDTMPWINLGLESKKPGIDTLLLPGINVPAIADNSAVANPDGSGAMPRFNMATATASR